MTEAPPAPSESTAPEPSGGSRIQEWLKAHGLFWGLFVGLCLLNLRPIWMVDIFPAADLHAHLGKVAMMHHMGDPEHFLAEFYQFGEFPYPNFFYYSLAYLLSLPFGMIAANQIIWSLYVFTFPLCLWFFLVTFERSRWLVLIAFLFLWNHYSFYGFIDFLYSIPFTFLGLALSRRFCLKPTWPRFLWATFAGLLLYVTHLQSFVTYCFLATTLYFLAIRKDSTVLTELKLLVLRGLTLVPSTALVLPWIFEQGFEPEEGVEVEEVEGSKNFGTFENLGATYDPWLKRLGDFARISVRLTHCEVPIEVFVLGMVVLAGAIAARRTPVPDTHSRLFARTPEILTFLSVAFYLFLPSHMEGLSVIHHRLAPIILLLLVAWPGPKPFVQPLATALLLVLPAITLQLFLLKDITHHVGVYARQIQGFEEVIKAAKPRTRLVRMIPYASHRGGPSFAYGLFRHVHNYHVIFNEGAIDDSFAKTPGRMVVLTGTPVGPSYGHHDGWARRSGIARNYDYALTRHTDPKTVERGGHWRLVKASGDWALFESVPRAEKAARGGSEG